MLLVIYVSNTTSPGEIIEAAKAARIGGQDLTWFQKTPGLEMIGGIRAIVPLMIFLLFVLKAVLREKISEAGIVAYGLALSLVGMMLFNVGLSYGLAKLGSQSGSLVPAAFAIGVGIALLFAWLLGFGATLAEPALNALGITVENLTNGAFKKSMLMYAVSVGVGFGIMIGVLKIIYDIPVGHILLPAYLLAAVMTFFSSEEFVNVAWDSAGVTTGPVTVPLVLAMGLGFGSAVTAIEGFGILAMASICPILSVLAMGLFIKIRIRKLERIDPDKVTAMEGPII